MIEAGQKGVVLLTKLDNGQYEVAPGPAAKAGLAVPAQRPRSPTESGAEASAGGARGREDGAPQRPEPPGPGWTRSLRRTGRRASPGSERHPSGGGGARSGRDERADVALTLARAFQLMAQALSEFRSPVGQEALRLRMVAMHGREDPLLDTARFPRLLRQANDAEVADVRKVGDDDYEISAQRQAARLASPPAPAADESPAGPHRHERKPELTTGRAPPGRTASGSGSGSGGAPAAPRGPAKFPSSAWSRSSPALSLPQRP